MKQINLREGARRQHRSISLFAVIQCWLRNLDGVAFQRAHLERLLGLERFKRTRVKWLEEDLKEFFPHQKTYWLTGKNNSLSSLFVARVPIISHLPRGSMTTAKRIAGIPAEGPRIALFELWRSSQPTSTVKIFESVVPFFADSANYDERFLSAYLALLAQGQISPQSLPSLKPGKSDESA
jgi:hypothetical protein